MYVCVRYSITGAYAPKQRKCSLGAVSLPERQYMEKVGAHDSFIFSKNFLSPLSASGGLNYLSCTRKEMLRDTRIILMERAQCEIHKHTHTHSHVRHKLQPTYIQECLHKYTQTQKHTGTYCLNMDTWFSNHGCLKKCHIHAQR